MHKNHDYMTPEERLGAQKAGAEYNHHLGGYATADMCAADVCGKGQGDVIRTSARSALRHRADKLRQDALRLEALAACIPDHFPRDADDALWQLLGQ